MDLIKILTLENILLVLAGGLISWLVAHYYAGPPRNIKLQKAIRYKETGFGEATVPKKDGQSIEHIDSPVGKYSINGDGTVSDLRNKLMWIQAPWGMTWDGEKFLGEPIKVDWWNATSLFGKGVTLGYPVGTLSEEHLERSKFENGYTKGKCTTSFTGYSNWRLPTAFEINTLGFTDPSGNIKGHERSRSEAANSLRERLFPCLGRITGNYWLWCAHEQGGGMAWAVDGSWAPGDYNAKNRYFVLFVRKF